MSKLRLLALVGLLAAASWPLSGCGNECGPGSTEKDGECVMAAEGCAEGTRLSGGECLVDSTGCGTGTMLDEETYECVPAGEACDEGATLDEAEGVCVPDTSVVCGAGTEVGESGKCEPSGEACGDKAQLGEDGRCIVGSAACGEGTELEPNIGECVLTDAACGEGLAFDAEARACMPTDEICETGTKFDEDSGLCLNDSCQVGDVLADGVCMTPGDELAEQAEFAESENNDPELGGTPNFLGLELSDGPVVFTGTIDEPSDLDGDGAADQDVDVYSFEAEAGDWFEIALHSTGLQSPAFVVEGPNDFVRYSQQTGARDVMRQIVAPAGGTYTLTVLPSLVLERQGELSPIGGADWTYVTSVEPIDAPEVTTIDANSDDTLSGDFVDLGDNLFEITGLSAGDSLRLEGDQVGGHVDALVQLWTDATTLSTTAQLTQGNVVDLPVSGSTARVLIDWSAMSAPSQSFELSASISGGETTLTLAPGDTQTLTVPAEAGDQILVRQTNPDNESLAVIIEGADGDDDDDEPDEIASRSALDSGSALTTFVDADGVYTVTFTNEGNANVDPTLVAKTVRPQSLGHVERGRTVSSAPFDVESDYDTDITFTANPGDILKISQTNDTDDSISIDLLDEAGNIIKEDDYLWVHGRQNRLEDYYSFLEVDGDQTYTFRVTDFMYDPTNVVVEIENLGPVASHLGTVGSGDSASVQASTPLEKGGIRFFTVDASASGDMLIEALTPNREDVDVYVYDSALAYDISTGFPESSSSGLEEQFKIDASPQTFYIIVHAQQRLPSFTLNVALEPTGPATPDYSDMPQAEVSSSNDVMETFTVSGCTAVESVNLYLDLPHEAVDDLTIELTSPMGTTVLISDGDIGDDDGITGWFPQTYLPEGNLYDFYQEYGNGEWTLTIDDGSYFDDGTLEEWGLTLNCG